MPKTTDNLPSEMSQSGLGTRKITLAPLARWIWGSGVGGELEGKKASQETVAIVSATRDECLSSLVWDGGETLDKAELKLLHRVLLKKEKESRGCKVL